MQSDGHIHSKVRRLRSQIGFIFQQFNLVSRLSVLDNVLAGNLLRTPGWQLGLRLFSKQEKLRALGALEQGIRATGASKLQEIKFGVIPQVMPLWTSFTLYRFEANVRSASVPGIVGAGGIGVLL